MRKLITVALFTAVSLAPSIALADDSTDSKLQEVLRVNPGLAQESLESRIQEMERTTGRTRSSIVEDLYTDSASARDLAGAEPDRGFGTSH